MIGMAAGVAATGRTVFATSFAMFASGRALSKSEIPLAILT